MTSILRFVQVFTLGTWVGGILLLSFAVAPGAFQILSNPEQAGTLVGLALTRLHLFGYAMGLLFLLATVWLAKSLAGLGRPAALLAVLMLVLTAASQQWVRPRMDRLRAQMGSIAATPASSPLRSEFDRLHRISVRLEGGVLLAGIAALFFVARQR